MGNATSADMLKGFEDVLGDAVPVKESFYRRLPGHPVQHNIRVGDNESALDDVQLQVAAQILTSFKNLGVPAKVALSIYAEGTEEQFEAWDRKQHDPMHADEQTRCG